jgi:GTPase SAR1 family protein
MDELKQLEKRVQAVYDNTLRPLAERLGFELPMSGRDAPGLPSVLFLGNHSSGKSSFINYLVGGEIQKTGLAPTDDGFTLITHGGKQDELDGQSIVTHPDLAYRTLQRHGPFFLSRLRLKSYPSDLLKQITLIDSPGMIDAAGTANSRGYDFISAVRHFAEISDLILFFFDPDKPGTTGESISIFTSTLTGLEHKLLIILNKVDLFENIRDFARTYGTLCWNLSRTVETKDIPHIFNIYLPGFARAPRASDSIPLQDFDVSREEVVSEILRAPTRRADNLVSGLYQNARELSVLARVYFEASRQFRAVRNKLLLIPVGVLVLTALLVFFTWNSEEPRTALVVLLLGLITAGAAWIAALFYLNRFRLQTFSREGLDECFDRTFTRQLAFQERVDLRALWSAVKNRTRTALEVIGPEKTTRAFSDQKLLRNLEQAIDAEIPALRRSLSHLRETEKLPPSAPPKSEELS